MHCSNWLKIAIASLTAVAACAKNHEAAPGPSAEAPEPPPDAPPAVHEHEHHEHGYHEHGHQHRHGAGYQMDFSEVERFAKHFDDPARDQWQKPAEVMRHLDIAPGQTVADVGAGTGYFLEYLSEAVGPEGKVLALDVEPKMVDYMKQRVAKAKLANVSPSVVSPADPGLAPNSVDRVLIVNTWHHIGHRAEYAAKLARALKPKGSVWIVDFTLDSDMGPPAEHRLTPQQVADELREGGLVPSIVNDESLPKQYLVEGTLPR